MPANDTFVIINGHNRAETYDSLRSWYDLLEMVYADTRSLGFCKLLRNGEIVNLPDKLSHIAFDYMNERRDAIDEAVREVNAKYPPPWE